MKPFKLVSNLVTVLLLGWLGITCFKLGWYAQENPFFRPLATTVLGLESQEPKNPKLLDRLQSIFNQTDTPENN